jgi:integrase
MSRVRLHDMRHYAASGALRAGVVDLTVSRMLGHSRTSTTKDLYGHVMPEDLSAAIDAIGRDIAWGDP